MYEFKHARYCSNRPAAERGRGFAFKSACLLSLVSSNGLTQSVTELAWGPIGAALG